VLRGGKMDREDLRIVLPEPEEMYRRLLTLEEDLHVKRNYFPILLQEAGRSLSPSGLVNVFSLTMYKYCENLSYAVYYSLFLLVPIYIDALVDDAEFVEAAKSFHAQVEEKLKSQHK
jgi:hypothetical protein